MPRIESAKKRMRQSVKRTARNRIRKEKLKKAVKTFRVSLAAATAAVGKPDKQQVDVAQELRKVSRAVDKAGVKGIIHKNTVNRRKSRLAKAVNRAKTAPASAAK